MGEPNEKPILDNSTQADPTQNVQNLLAAAVVRIDDLFAAEQLRLDGLRTAEIRRVDERRVDETLRVNEAIAAERLRVNEVMAITSKYEALLREAEANRINAIRAVDVAAVATAAERAATSATILATQVQVQAETLRSLVATTQTASDLRFAQVTSGQTERIAALEKAFNVSTGRETRDDPALAQLTASVAALVAAQNKTTGQGAGINIAWVVALGGVSVLGLIIGAIALALRFAGI